MIEEVAYFQDLNQPNVVIENEDDYSHENEHRTVNRGALKQLSTDFDETEYKNDMSPLPTREQNTPHNHLSPNVQQRSTMRINHRTHVSDREETAEQKVSQDTETSKQQIFQNQKLAKEVTQQSNCTESRDLQQAQDLLASYAFTSDKSPLTTKPSPQRRLTPMGQLDNEKEAS